LDLNCGDIVTVAPTGEFGKPRPALVLQKRVFPETEVITVALITSSDWTLPDIRVPIARTQSNGLEKDSFVMIDMVQTYSRAKYKKCVGRADESVLHKVREALTVFFGFDSSQ
jgi:mRNA interferase MazF